MTSEEYTKLNGERLMHTVWVVNHRNKIVGISDQTPEGVAHCIKHYGTKNVVRIDCVGYTMESKVREIERWVTNESKSAA